MPQILDRNGKRHSIAQAVGLPRGGPTLLGDIIRWTRVVAGHVRFTFAGALRTGDQQLQAEKLAHILLVNLLEIATMKLYEREVAFTACDHGSPRVVHLRHGSTIEALSSAGVMESPTAVNVGSHTGLVRALGAYTGSAVELKVVHPHPLLSRLAYLWVDRRRWSRSRGMYKQ